MPAQILHTLFGEAVIAETYGRLYHGEGQKPAQIQEICRGRYRSAFMLGCQGPDIFYHSQMTRPVALEYGTLLHRRDFGNFAARLFARSLAQGSPERTPLGVYALGFMTHALLDRACHPYIVYKSNPLGSSAAAERFAKIFRPGTAHAFFERILDVLRLEYVEGKRAESWDQYALVDGCSHPPAGLTELLAETLIEAYPDRAGKDEKLFQRISNALGDCAVFYCGTDPRLTAQYTVSSVFSQELPLQHLPLAYLYPDRFPLYPDYLNLSRQVWFYPSAGSPADTRSFLDIFYAAVHAGGDIFSSFLLSYHKTGAIPIMETARRIGNGGLSIQDTSGKPCPAERTNPLPLDEILTHQYAIRGRA
jgi:hypothetical protein